MARYFLNEIPNRPVEVSGRTYEFDIVTATLATFEATTDQQIADLSSIAGRAGITEIDKAEFDQLQAQKKTTPTSLHSKSLSAGQLRAVLPQASRLPVSLERKQGVAYAADEAKPDAASPDADKQPTLSEIAEQVKKVAAVNSPAPVEADKRAKK